MRLALFIAKIIIFYISCVNVISIKYNNHFKFAKNPIAGNLNCVPIFSIVQESDRPLILSQGKEYFTLSFSNPYDAMALMTELIQSSNDKVNLWRIKAYTLENWISKMKDDKKFGLKHRLIHSTFENRFNTSNEFEVYYCEELKMDGKTLIFFDIIDLENEIKNLPLENRSGLKNNIKSTCLMNLITNDRNKIDNYSFVPSKTALEYLTFRRI